jgi:phage tail-like protein
MPLAADIKLALANRFQLVVTVPSEMDLGSWNKVEGLDVKFDVADYRAGDNGNDRWYFPGKTEYQTIKLTRGVCKDTKTVMDWLARTAKGGDKIPDNTAMLNLYGSNPDDGPIHSWELRSAFASHWSVGGGFEAGASRVVLETLEIVHMGFLEDEFKLA